jgi:hypothetical protein
VGLYRRCQSHLLSTTAVSLRRQATGNSVGLQSILRTAASGTVLPVAMSANCNRPPGRKVRITPLNTRRLSARRLITPLLMMTMPPVPTQPENVTAFS